MEESKLKKILSSRASHFILLLAFIWLALVLVKAGYKKYQLEQEINGLKTEIQKLDSSGQELSQMMEYFSTQGFLEKEAKEKLNLKKEGETVVLVPEAAVSESIQQEEQTASSTPAAESASPEANPEPKNNPVKWWEFLFKK